MLNECTKKAPVAATTDVKQKFKLFTKQNYTTLRELEKQRDLYSALLWELDPKDRDWEPVLSLYRRYDKQVRDYVKEF